MNGKLPAFVALLLAALAFVAAGCGETEKPNQVKAKDSEAKKAEADDHGWWCREHGMPEAECAQCNQELAAKLREKGDWCEKHDRPESQCFICNPKLKEAAANKYRAKYGKEPPPIEDEERK